MKKIVALASAFLLCLALAGCSQASSSSSSSTFGDSSTEASATAPASALEDGVYEIEIDTDSSMVNVVAGLLDVQDGTYTVSMSLNGEGFSRLFLGSADDAASAADADIYDYRLNEDGKYTFDFHVEALDEEVDVALFGQRRDTWYDHVLVFHAPTGEALSEAAGRPPSASGSSGEAAASDAAAGEHEIEVTLSGGSGKATVESPAKLVVAEDGTMTATIVWSSPNYDQMVVDGVQYLPVNASGNSTFEIPVAALDEDLSVQAETTAMSEPHMIDYTLRFDSSSLS